MVGSIAFSTTTTSGDGSAVGSADGLTSESSAKWKLKFSLVIGIVHRVKLPDCWSTIDSLLVISCDVDVDGFGVDGADGVDVPDVDAVADEHGTPSFTILTIPLRPQVNTQFQIQTQYKQKNNDDGR